MSNFEETVKSKYMIMLNKEGPELHSPNNFQFTSST
jgi:hypothetical protein